MNYESASVVASLNVAQLATRETIEVWDPVQKCKVVRYKDELEKELYKDLYKGLSIGIEQSLEFGA